MLAELTDAGNYVQRPISDHCQPEISRQSREYHSTRNGRRRSNQSLWLSSRNQCPSFEVPSGQENIRPHDGHVEFVQHEEWLTDHVAREDIWHRSPDQARRQALLKGEALCSLSDENVNLFQRWLFTSLKKSPNGVENIRTAWHDFESEDECFLGARVLGSI